MFVCVCVFSGIFCKHLMLQVFFTYLIKMNSFLNSKFAGILLERLAICTRDSEIKTSFARNWNGLFAVTGLVFSGLLYGHMNT